MFLECQQKQHIKIRGKESKGGMKANDNLAICICNTSIVPFTGIG